MLKQRKIMPPDNKQPEIRGRRVRLIEGTAPRVATHKAWPPGKPRAANSLPQPNRRPKIGRTSPDHARLPTQIRAVRSPVLPFFMRDAQPQRQCVIEPKNDTIALLLPIIRKCSRPLRRNTLNNALQEVPPWLPPSTLASPSATFLTSRPTATPTARPSSMPPPRIGSPTASSAPRWKASPAA